VIFVCCGDGIATLRAAQALAVGIASGGQRMKPERPDITVIIAAWRAADRLRDAVDSALAQRGVSVEVVVVDDASTDSTFSVAEDLARADPRVRAFRLGRNGGPSAARNRALTEAQADWVAVLDADDRMVPRRLERMLALARERGADVVLGNLATVDGQGQSVSDEPFITSPDQPVALSAEDFVRGNLPTAGARTLGYLKPLIRRGFLEQHGVRYDPRLRNGEDYHLILACLLRGASVWFSPDPDYLYTRMKGSLSERIGLDHLAALIAVEEAVIATTAAPPALAALMHRRMDGLVDLMTTETVLRALKDRRFAHARDAMKARPRAVALVLRQAGEGLLRRIKRA
jgi:succinoglycan biosynthesis protein ExoO